MVGDGVDIDVAFIADDRKSKALANPKSGFEPVLSAEFDHLLGGATRGQKKTATRIPEAASKMVASLQGPRSASSRSACRARDALALTVPIGKSMVAAASSQAKLSMTTSTRSLERGSMRPSPESSSGARRSIPPCRSTLRVGLM